MRVSLVEIVRIPIGSLRRDAQMNGKEPLKPLILTFLTRLRVVISTIQARVLAAREYFRSLMSNLRVSLSTRSSTHSAQRFLPHPTSKIATVTTKVKNC